MRGAGIGRTWGGGFCLVVGLVVVCSWSDAAAAGVKAYPWSGALLANRSGVSARAGQGSQRGFAMKPLDAPLRSTGRVSLKAANPDTCDGYWQGQPTFRSVGWILGQEVYACYQDPSETGCVSPYPFAITDVFWAVQVDLAITLRLQPVVASNDGTPSCPHPGTLLCLGLADSIALTPGAWLIQMPLDAGCSVSEPYFAGAYLPDPVTPNVADLIFDADTANPIMCRSYNDWGEGWQDLAVAFPNLILFSQGHGMTPSCACNCHGDPVCDGIADVMDVVQAVSVAFRNGTPTPDPNSACPRQTTDVTCDGLTDVLDVVNVVSVAFRNGNPATVFCAPCPAG